jgi:hypothetical protein
MKNRGRKALAVLALAVWSGACICYGGASYKYHLPPYPFIKSLFGAPCEHEIPRTEKDLMEQIFVDELVSPDELVLPPCRTIADVRAQLDTFHRCLQDHPHLPDVAVTGSQCLKNLLEVQYRFQGEHSAFAYSASTARKQSRMAALIIPGSGENQSHAIVTHQEANYHGQIVDWLKPHADVYVFIKPNQGVLAIHNGIRKIDGNYIYADLINRGKSYSFDYLVRAVAVIRFLQEKYETVALFGISQGGAAVLLCSLYTEPDGAFVASGYSVLLDDIYPAGQDQIMFPGVASIFSKEAVRDAIGKMRTRFVFSWGRLEPDIYGYETNAHPTEKYFKGTENMRCVYHAGGHEFPSAQVRQFIQEMRDAP